MAESALPCPPFFFTPKTRPSRLIKSYPHDRPLPSARFPPLNGRFSWKIEKFQTFSWRNKINKIPLKWESITNGFIIQIKSFAYRKHTAEIWNWNVGDLIGKLSSDARLGFEYSAEIVKWRHRSCNLSDQHKTGGVKVNRNENNFINNDTQEERNERISSEKLQTNAPNEPNGWTKPLTTVMSTNECVSGL